MSIHETRRVVNNVAFLTVGYFFVRLLTMLSTLYAARELGPSDYGSLSSGLNIAVLVSIFANLGLTDYVVLTTAREPQKAGALLGNSILLKLFVVPLIFGGALWLGLKDPQYTWLFMILMLYSILHSYQVLFCSAFRGMERMEFHTLLLLVQAVILSVGSIIAVWLTKDPTIASLAYLVGTILSVSLGYFLLRKVGIRPEYHWQPFAWKQIFLTSLPFGLIYVYLTVYDRLPTILILALVGKKEVGWYNSVYTMTMVLATLPAIVMGAVFPLLARKSQQNQQSIEGISAQLMKYTTILSFGVAIALMILAPVIIPFLFGDAYAPSIWILRVLAIGIPALFLPVNLVNSIEAMGEQRLCARYSGYALLFALPVCLFAVWRWGYQGGTVAYVINNVFFLLVMLWLAHRLIGNLHLVQSLLIPGFIGTVVLALLYIVQQWPFYVLLPLSIVIYLAGLVLSGSIGALEVDLVRKILQSRGWLRPTEPVVHPAGRD